jgi:YbbR domain-containing protein
VGNVTGLVKSLFVNNWTLKVLAILLGLVCFYAIRGAISFEVPYTVPIEVQMGPGMAVLEKSVDSLDVTFGGSQEDLRHLDQTQLKAVVKPREIDSGGSEVVTVRPEQIVGHGKVRVLSIRPGTVTLTYDREAERDVIVLKPKTTGVPLMGRVELDYEPKAVRLRGPKRRLANINAVSCEPVDVDGRVESFQRKVAVLSPGDAWTYQIEPREIMVDVKVVTERISRVVTNVTVLAVSEPGAPAIAELEPRAVHVSLLGRTEVLEAIPRDAVRVYVNCVGLESDAAYELPVLVHLPPEADVEAVVQPKTVRVQLRER